MFARKESASKEIYVPLKKRLADQKLSENDKVEKIEIKKEAKKI